MADTMLETLKIVGSLVGLATGIFVIIDRFLRCRPVAYLRPSKDDTDNLGLVVYNPADEAIIIDAIECHPPTARVSFTDDWRDILDPDWKGSIAIIAPNSQKVFTWLSLADWEKHKSEDGVWITVRWSFTSSRWLPLVPVWIRTTAGRLNQISNAMPPSPP